MDPKVYEQIEKGADYYEPGLYMQLLTAYKDYEAQPDALALSFIPLSAAQKSRNTKLFAIGVIPPSANVTGKLLDRSASIANQQGFSESAAATSPVPDPVVQAPAQAKVNSTDPPRWGTSAQNLPQSFWIAYVAMCQRLGVDPNNLGAVIYMESGFAAKPPTFTPNHPAKGLNQFIRSTAIQTVGMTPQEWENYQNLTEEQQLQYVEKFFKKTNVKGKTSAQIYRKNFGGYNNPDGSLYASKAHIDSHPKKDLFPRPDHQEASYQQNKPLAHGKLFITAADLAQSVANLPPQFIKDQIAAAQALLDAGAVPPQPSSSVPSDGTTGNWKDDGSKNAQTASKEQAKTAGTPLNQTDLGKRYQEAQKAQIREIQNAIESLRNTPPLRMLVNPQKFGIKGAKIVSDGSWGRNGHIIEHWGDDQDKISASGKVAGFYALDVLNATGPGLTRHARNFSQAWQNLQSLFLFYKNNGGLYLTDYTDLEQKQILTMLGSIYIYYDSILYIGSFDSFTVSESENAPHTAEYSFEFSVRAAFTLDRTDDMFDYGASSLFAKPQTIPYVDVAAAEERFIQTGSFIENPDPSLVTTDSAEEEGLTGDQAATRLGFTPGQR